MKKSSLLILITSLLLLLPLAGCRSGKNAASKPALTEQQEFEKWKNVTIPVKITILKPQRFSFSGTATMVRNEYILVSLRFLGFEVGRLHLSPETADVVLKQPQKVWIQTDVASQLSRTGLTFAQLQEALLGDREFADKMPSTFNVSFAGTENAPEVTVSGVVKGKAIEATLSWDLDAARWNTESPATFTEPGSAYLKTSVENALKALGGN